MDKKNISSSEKVCQSLSLFGFTKKNSNHYNPANKLADNARVVKGGKYVSKKAKMAQWVSKNSKSLPFWLEETVLADRGLRCS